MVSRSLKIAQGLGVHSPFWAPKLQWAWLLKRRLPTATLPPPPPPRLPGIIGPEATLHLETNGRIPRRLAVDVAFSVEEAWALRPEAQPEAAEEVFVKLPPAGHGYHGAVGDAHRRMFERGCLMGASKGAQEEEVQLSFTILANLDKTETPLRC